jgi:hypothetical protein
MQNPVNDNKNVITLRNENLEYNQELYSYLDIQEEKEIVILLVIDKDIENY